MHYLNFFFCCLIFIPALTYTEPQDKLSLIFVNVLWRHGARSPVSSFPSDPHGPGVWPQGLGQLTQVGMKQQYELGMFLKQRYNNLLSPMYKRSEIYIRSTDVDRTLMSAECNLAGMYPPQGRQQWNGTKSDWQPVPVHTVPVAEDKILRFPPTNSSKYNETIAKVWNLPQFKELELKNKEFFDEIRNFTKFPEPLTVRNIYKVGDVLICEKFQNLSLPSWLTEERYDKIRNISNVEMGATFGFNTQYVNDIARISSGFLVKQILSNMDDVISNSSSYKMISYSAHDTTLSALLVALQAYDGLSPSFAASIMLELYQKSSSSGDVSYVVKAFYRKISYEVPKPIQLLGCPIECPLDELMKRAADILPQNLPKPDPDISPSCNDDTGIYKIYLYISSLLLLLTWLAIVVRYIRSKRKDYESRRKYQPLDRGGEDRDDLYLM